MVEDGDVLPCEAVRDPSSAVYVVALHDDCVLYLGVPDGCVVSDARVGADTCVEVNLGVVVDDGGASHGGPAVDYGASACGFSGSRVMTPASMAAMSAFFAWNGPCFCME